MALLIFLSGDAECYMACGLDLYGDLALLARIERINAIEHLAATLQGPFTRLSESNGNEWTKANDALLAVLGVSENPTFRPSRRAHLQPEAAAVAVGTVLADRLDETRR